MPAGEERLLGVFEPKKLGEEEDATERIRETLSFEALEKTRRRGWPGTVS